MIFCDNSGSGKIDSSIESIARTKHIEVAHLWIQQEVAKKSEGRIFWKRNLFHLSINFRLKVLMRRNFMNPKTGYYLHYRGSVYCTEQKILFHTGHARFCKDVSSTIFSVYKVNFDSFSGNILLTPEMSNIDVLCRAMDFIELAIFPALELSQTTGLSLQMKLTFSTL